ncbi:beta strand repeat-containing protein [Trichloromonas sp.]|uniref:beta strand repeat-containing protein n=1 Tax=Trichloromonas sp. TaxID=3069249 RepID=UPI002A3F17F8|nr:hypothetical protein [Trichloromonas sp.]
MAVVTGTNLLQEILDAQGITLSPLMEAALAARLQQAIDAGTDSNFQIAAVLASNPTINASVPEGEVPLTFIADVVGDAKTTIIDEPVEPIETTYTITSDVDSVDEGGTVTFTVTADEAVVEDTEVAYTLSGVDAADVDGELTGTVTILAGETAATFAVTLLEDAATEGDETLTATLEDGAAADVAVADTSMAPAQVLSIEPASTTIVEGNELVFTVTMDRAVDEDTVIRYQVQGVATDIAAAATPVDDLGVINGEVLIAADGDNPMIGTFSITPSSDGVTEGFEAFKVVLLNDDNTAGLSTANIVITDPANAGQSFTLTTSVDDFTGGAGDDTFTATDTTLTALDALDGGDGADVLKYTDVAGGKGIPGGVSISNIETITVRSSGAATIDLAAAAGVTGVSTLKSTQSAAATLTAADTTDIVVSGATGAITINGGNNVQVADATADMAIKVGAATANAGTITVTDSNQGTGTIDVDGGTDVSVTATTNATAAVVGGTVKIGVVTPATGTVTLEQNLNHNGEGGNLAGGAITVVGGTSVDVTVNATSTAKNDDSDNDIAIGAVDVTGDGTTSEVTVTQNATTTVVTTAAVPAIAETDTVTFKSMAAGDTLTTAGSGTLVFKAVAAMTAEEVAAAFTNLINSDTQSAGGPTAKGYFTGAFSPVWSSAEASGASVIFTANSDAETNVTWTHSVVANNPTIVNTPGTAAVAGDASTNAVTYGAVTIADDATAAIKTVTVDGYATASAINGTTVLDTLNLSNAAATVAMTVADTADTLALNLSAMGKTGDGNEAVLTFTAAPLTLNVTSTGDNYVDLTAAATKTLNVSGTGLLDVADIDLAALQTVKVSGTAGLSLYAGVADTVTSVDTTGTTGTVTASIQGDKATYAGGAGVDNVTVTNADTAISKALDLGASNDTLTLVGATVAVPTVVLKGGDGTDTLSIDTASAAALDGATTFAAQLDSFEHLFINDAGIGGENILLDNLGFTQLVSVAGSGATLTLSNLANNGTVNVVAAPTTGLTVVVKDADTGIADVLNVGLSADTGVLTAANVETVNLTVDADVTATLTADKATTVTLAGDSDLVLTDLKADGSTLVELVDGSAGYSGDLTMTADLADLVVKGGSGDDFLIADANDVALYGGDGDDILVVDSGLRVNLYGGEGADTFEINGSLTLDAYAVINGVTSGDVIQMNGANTFMSSKIALSVGADETLLNYANQAVDTLAEGEMGWFQRGGNTFIVQDVLGTDSTEFIAGEDMIIMLTGLVDLGAVASYNTNNSLEIA